MTNDVPMTIVLERYHPDFRCLWGFSSVKRVSVLIGIVHLQCTLFFFSMYMAKGMITTRTDPFVIMTLVDLAILTIFFCGLRKEKRYYLIPYLIYQGLLIVGIIMELVEYFYDFLEPTDYIKNKISRRIERVFGVNVTFGESDELRVQLLALFMMIFYTIASIIAIWCCSIVYRCYQYFKYIAQLLDDDEVFRGYIPWIAA